MITVKCDGCIHRNKNLPNECEIFYDQNNDWNCHTTIEEYREILRSEIRHLRDMNEQIDEEEDRERKSTIRDCEIKLNELDKYRE